MNGTKKIKYSRTDQIILGIAYVFLGVFVLSILIPLIYVVLASFMDPTVLNNQGLSFHIKDWTLDAYRRVLENDMIWRGFLNSFLYSIAFTAISVFVTLLAAYPMSKKEFVGRKFFNIIFLITMFFGGGMIPTFILINQLHMVNTIWAILIPGAFNVWNMILARTYYQSIPKELREASAIDGATEKAYTVTANTQEDCGVYSVAVSSPSGTVKIVELCDVKGIISQTISGDVKAN